jgi:rhodanese-related sulfurtransferase
VSEVSRARRAIHDGTMKIPTIITSVLLLAAVGCGRSSYPDISIAELKSAIASNSVVVMDVNGSSSYRNGHIPGAIDYHAHKKDLASKLPADKNTLIVAYCGGPTCGAYKSAAKAARALGYTNVKHLSAGISGWLQAGETIEKAE